MMRSFGRDRQGGVAMLFAIALVPMMAMVGAAIDYGAAMRNSAACNSSIPILCQCGLDEAAPPGLAAAELACQNQAPGGAVQRRVESVEGETQLVVAGLADLHQVAELVEWNLRWVRRGRHPATIGQPGLNCCVPCGSTPSES